MNIRTSQTKALGTAAVAAFLLLASCGSETDSTLEAVEDDVESTTTTEAPSAPATEPAAVSAEMGDGAIAIQADFDFASASGPTFVVEEGAELLGCNSGSLAQGQGIQGIANTFTCEAGDRAGSFTFDLVLDEGLEGPGQDTGTWSVLNATGDFAGLTGEGLATAVVEGESGFISFPGVIEFGPIVATAEADPAIVADLDAYVVAYFTGDTEVAWNTVSARCQDVFEKEWHDGTVAELTLTAPGATVSDISTVVEGDRAAVTYNVYDDAGVLFAPYFAQPWIFADGNWQWDNC